MNNTAYSDIWTVDSPDALNGTVDSNNRTVKRKNVWASENDVKVVFDTHGTMTHEKSLENSLGVSSNASKFIDTDRLKGNGVQHRSIGANDELLLLYMPFDSASLSVLELFA